MRNFSKKKFTAAVGIRFSYPEQVKELRDAFLPHLATTFDAASSAARRKASKHTHWSS